MTTIPLPHKAVYIQGNINRNTIIDKIVEGSFFGNQLETGSLKSAVYSSLELAHFVDEEIRHGQFKINTGITTTLAHASSGEQRRALLSHILASNPGLLIVDNVFENLDQEAVELITVKLKEISTTVVIVQLLNRRSDLLPFIQEVYSLQDVNVSNREDRQRFLHTPSGDVALGNIRIPGPLHHYTLPDYPLVRLNKISVQYNGRPVLHNICWQINAGEFWHLRGPNGSGKSTLLSMITGDNPKGYGQDMQLFGIQKGTGETVWQIKENIGYFAPNMARYFERQDTVAQMIVSGFFDSVGLYLKPSEMQVKRANDWLTVLDMQADKNKPFRLLPDGRQRMVLIARAMVKHPPLLILDEPASGLDDNSTLLFTGLVNRIAAETETAILYVSHRTEAGLAPDHVFQLIPGSNGSTGASLQ